MKKIISLTTFMLLIALSCFAQKKAIIQFDKTTHDFGTFEEEKGKVTTEFQFKNVGDAPLLITRTAASCGCTTPEYPKTPIAPGKSGVIKVTYNAKGRPGVFQKTVYVFANTDPEKSTLIIKGHVNAAPPKKENNYPKQIGELRLKSKYVPLFDVYPPKTKSDEIEVYNPTNAPLTVTFQEVPKHMNVTITPSPLPARREGKIKITFDPEKAKDWGMRKDYISVVVGNPAQPLRDNIIIVSSDIREDFSKMNADEQAKAPVMVIAQREINFGNISGKTTQKIEIKNNGKSDLIIRKINNSNKSFECEMSKTTIQPGKSAQLKVTCLTNKATQKKLNNHITLISNDPKCSNLTLRLQASIN